MDDAAILDVIRDHPDEAAGALAAIQSGERPLTVPAIAVLARRAKVSEAHFWLQQLQERGLVASFVAALHARGVALENDVLDDPDGVIATERLQRFLAQAQAFRCRIVKNGTVAGSGVLLGPSLVLTSWHVIAVAAPGQPQDPAPDLQVLLGDGVRSDIKLPAAFQSECGDAEYRSRAPVHDDDVTDRHDVALLHLVEPAAIHLGHVSLPARPPVPKGRSRVVLVHFPGGSDAVIDFGLTGKIRRVTARWRHDVPTAAGSSGGACFDRELQLLGVHQAQFDTGARFVPTARFLDAIMELVQADVAPRLLWSLDGTPEGRLVIGRLPFFQAVAAAGDGASRVRGVRIKRSRIESGTTGLAFSYEILKELVARRGPDHLLVRVTQDQVIDDLLADIRLRARASGLNVVETPAEEPGIATGQAPPETTIKHRAETLAASVDAAAAEAGSTVWFFFDNPSVAMCDAARFALEGFVGAALARAHLRLVIAGFETLAFPGAEFMRLPVGDIDQSPGLLVEVIGEFRRADVLDMLTIASKDLTGAVDQDSITYAADRALFELEHINGLYDPNLLPTVAERLGTDLRILARGAR